MERVNNVSDLTSTVIHGDSVKRLKYTEPAELERDNRFERFICVFGIIIVINMMIMIRIENWFELENNFRLFTVIYPLVFILLHIWSLPYRKQSKIPIPRRIVLLQIKEYCLHFLAYYGVCIGFMVVYILNFSLRCSSHHEIFLISVSLLIPQLFIFVTYVTVNVLLMSWREDPRARKLLTKSWLESLFKMCFKSIYVEEEVLDMEKVLRGALHKYAKKDLFEKLSEEEGAEAVVQECLNSLYEIKCEDLKPESMLILARLLMKVDDCRLACEALWCCASLTIQEFITSHRLNITLYANVNERRSLTRNLSRNIWYHFNVLEVCHLSFFENKHSSECVEAAYNVANDFVHLLREYSLSEEKRKELENVRENCNESTSTTTSEEDYTISEEDD